MSGVIVDDRVDRLSLRHLGLDGIEEADELLMPMVRHTAAGDFTFQDVEGGEQRSGAVALIVVGHGTGASLLHRQAGLGAIESLNLTLLVNRENNSVIGRIDVEPDDVLELGGKGRVIGQLELIHPVRFEAVRAPNTLHRADADPDRLGHGRRRPVGRLARRRSSGEIDDLTDNFACQRRFARRAGLVAQQPIHPPA